MKKKIKLQKKIKKDFNDRPAEERKEILFGKGKAPNLNDEVTKAKVLKDFITPHTKIKTDEFTKNIEETEERIVVLDKLIKESRESSKYTMIAEAVIKRDRKSVV